MNFSGSYPVTGRLLFFELQDYLELISNYLPIILRVLALQAGSIAALGGIVLAGAIAFAGANPGFVGISTSSSDFR